MARIVETGPLLRTDVVVDPASLDIIEHALRNARQEMDAVIFRTAMSPGIREQHDAFPMLADRSGRMIAGQFGSFIDGFLRTYDGEIQDGDLFFTSDPYACDGAVSHANDWLVLLPVFVAGTLVGWSAMFGHMTDVGGKVPGSLPTDALTIFEEGVIVPPIKLFRAGQINDAVLEVVLNQVRVPQWNRSDLNSLIAACRTGARRIAELCERFGVDTYASALEMLLQRNHRAMARLLTATVPTDPVSFFDYVDDDGLGGGPYKLACRMWREGDRVVLDWSETDPQAVGPINFLVNENMLKMFFGVYMIMAFDPQILFNDGFYPLVEVRIPEGSLLKPRYPAALSCRTHALGRLFDVLGGLLGQCRPEFLCAAGFSSSPHLMYSGVDRDGEWFQLYQIGFGGVPGRPVGDGPDGHSMWPSFNNVPNEFLESYYPLRIERYETVPDSGGPGYHRGGNGLHVAYRFLEDGSVSIHDDRWLTYPWGVKGGLPGRRGRKVLELADGTRRVVPSKADHIEVRRGDVLHYITWGGGGWGDPLTRDPDRVVADVVRGLLSRDGARRYGVILDDDLHLDDAATQRLRSELAAQKGVGELFDRGGTLEELLTACEQQTGLPAPRRPSRAALPARTSVQAAPVAASSVIPPEHPGRAGRRPPTPLEELIRALAEEVVARR
jgi:N-methylhydantoinase B